MQSSSSNRCTHARTKQVLNPEAATNIYSVVCNLLLNVILATTAKKKKNKMAKK